MRDKLIVVIFIMAAVSFVLSILALFEADVKVHNVEAEKEAIIKYVDENLYICPECGKGLSEFDSYGYTSVGYLKCGNCGWQGRNFHDEHDGSQEACDVCIKKAKESYLENYGTPWEVLRRFMDKE